MNDSAPGGGSGTIRGRGLHRLHVDQTLRDVNLIVRLQDHIFLRAAFLDHALQIHHKILAAFAGQLSLFACWQNRRNHPRG